MKITRIAIYQVPLTSVATYYMAEGKTCDTVDTVIVEMQTDAGITGWGEVCAIPHYLAAYAGGVAPAVEELAPCLLGADPLGPAAVMARCDAFLQGHVYAKSAVDIALWDVTAKAAGLPLYRLLGGRMVDAAPLYHSITCIAPTEMARIAKEVYADGIRQFQIKLGADNDWQADVARIKEVRAVLGAEALLYGDWNCGGTKLTVIRVAQAVRDLDVMLEQPCATLAACADVRRATGLAMKLDESCHDTESLLQAHALGCMDVATLKLSKFGGITPLCRARDLCLHLGVAMTVEDTWGSDIVTAALAHVAVTLPAKFLQNACDLSGYVNPHIASDGPLRDNARLKPSERPGLGVTPDPGVLGAPLTVIQ